jgi:hypothetical protein
MQDEKEPLALKHQPAGKRSTGYHKKRWKPQFLEEK